MRGIKLAKHLKSRLANREEHGTTHTPTESCDCRQPVVIKKNSIKVCKASRTERHQSG